VLELEEVFQISLSDEEVVDMTSLRQGEALLLKRGIAGVGGTDGVVSQQGRGQREE